jgi:hypothetical protein
MELFYKTSRDTLKPRLDLQRIMEIRIVDSDFENLDCG